MEKAFNTKRIEWVDALKGYAICMMMFSHMEFAPDFVKNFISPLFLAAFFVAAGYTFHADSDFKTFFLKKCRTLLWPWLVFASFNISLTQILTFSEQEPLGKQFLDLFLQIRGQNDGLWFFPCMFAVIILYYILHHLIPNRKLFFALQPLLLLIGIFYTLSGGAALPWHIQMWGAGCFYLSLGYGFRLYEQRLSFLTGKAALLISCVVFTVTSVLCFYRYPDTHINFYDYGFSIPFYFVIMLSGVVFTLSAVRLLPPFRIVQYAGRNSLMYFAFHGKPKRLFTVLFTKAGLITGNWILDLALALCEVILLSFLLVIPCEIIHRFFPFLLGQKFPNKPKK